MGVLALMALAQVQQIPVFKKPLMSLACGLIFGSIGMYYFGNGLKEADPLPFLFAYMAGTVAYFFIVLPVILLFRPDLKAWILITILMVSLVGSVIQPTGLGLLTWNVVSREMVLIMGIWAAGSSRNRETPFMRRLTLGLITLALVGTLPQLISLVQAEQAIDQYFDPQNIHAAIQSIAWTITALMSYLTVTAVVQGRISARLNYAADFDYLTQVNNRRALMNFGETLLKHNSSTLLLMDVDHFKKINDIHGHLIGDAVLVHIAQVIKEAVRDYDSVVGRYGGEEFCIMLRNTTIDQAQEIAERVRFAVESTSCQLPEGTIAVSISIGAAELTQGQSLQEWLKEADKCLYQAKLLGRNRVSVNYSLPEDLDPGFIV